MPQKREFSCAFEASLVSVTKRLCCLSLAGDNSTIANHCSEITSASESGDEVNMPCANIGYKRSNKELTITGDDPWHVLCEAIYKAWEFCSNCSNVLTGIQIIHIPQYTIMKILVFIILYVTLACKMDFITGCNKLSLLVELMMP